MSVSVCGCGPCFRDDCVTDGWMSPLFSNGVLGRNMVSAVALTSWVSQGKDPFETDHAKETKRRKE